MLRTHHKSRFVEAPLVFIRSPVATIAYLVASLLNQKGARRLDFGSAKLWVRTGSPDIKVVRNCLMGEFDEALDLTRTEHDFIVDAGGYIGAASIMFAQRFPGSTVVCLEPSEENYALAKRNCAPYPNIKVLNLALGATSGTVKLIDRGHAQWGFTTVEDPADASETTELGAIDAISMDDLFARYGKAGADLLKLDIEGGEHALLQARPDWVDRCGVITAELHDHVVPGASAVFEAATLGRRNMDSGGEKRISLRIQ